jgi:Leucine-rich repeat (LRR) protein
LELVNTRIKRLPKRLAAIKSLKKVSVLNNRPKGRLKLGKNKTIETLVIHDDEVNKLPKTYRHLGGLKTLDLSRNNLSSFPRLKRYSSLRKLSLADNLLTLNDLKQGQPLLEDLVLTTNLIKKVPDAIGLFTGLKKLNLSANQIESVSPEIGKLQKLEHLSFYKNKLRSIPAEMFTLKSLHIVDLYYNQLEDLDPLIGNWSSLEILYAANNKLLRLPNELGQLKNLRELYVHHNRLTTLPETLGGVDSLRVLRVNNNFLVELPQVLYALKNLENLDVSDNQIQTFPEQLFALPKMKILSLKNNPVDPATKESIILWARRAMVERHVVIHLEGAGEPGTD